jgi:hypothetical protein
VRQPLPSDEIESLLGGRAGPDLEAGGLQLPLDEPQEIGIVLDGEDAALGSVLRSERIGWHVRFPCQTGWIVPPSRPFP